MSLRPSSVSSFFLLSAPICASVAASVSRSRRMTSWLPDSVLGRSWTDPPPPARGVASEDPSLPAPPAAPCVVLVGPPTREIVSPIPTRARELAREPLSPRSLSPWPSLDPMPTDGDALRTESLPPTSLVRTSPAFPPVEASGSFHGRPCSSVFSSSSSTDTLFTFVIVAPAPCE